MASAMRDVYTAQAGKIRDAAGRRGKSRLRRIILYTIEIHACSNPRLTNQKCNYILGT